MEVSNYSSLFLAQQQLLDVRSPAEFVKGAFPGAVNIPLMTDEERRLTGIRYKENGQRAAMALGHELISGDEKQARLNAWCQFARQNPNGHLYCFRGGLRSKIVQSWLAEAGIDYPRIEGGYKMMRQFLIRNIEKASSGKNFIIIGGKTGCAKTHLLTSLPGNIDLEGLANHRGSAFGRKTDDQPTQIDFENKLSIKLLKLADHSQSLFLEDESRAIGKISLPFPLFEKMKKSPLVIIEEPLEKRVNVILDDYIMSNYNDFQCRDASTAKELFSDYLTDSLNRIQRRLGGKLAQEISTDIRHALSEQWSNGNISGHKNWIRKLLLNYYDSMYDYQLMKKDHRVIFRGSRQDFSQWIKSHPGAQRE